MFKWEYIIEDKKTGEIISRIENSLQWTFYNYAQVSFFNSWYALTWVLKDPDLYLGTDSTSATKWDAETTSWPNNNYWVVKSPTLWPFKKSGWERVDWENWYAQVKFEIPSWNQQIVNEVGVVSNVLSSDGGNSRFWLSRAVNSGWITIPDWGAFVYYRINIDFSTLTNQNAHPMIQWVIKAKDSDYGWYFDSLFFSPGNIDLDDLGLWFSLGLSDATIENTATELASPYNRLVFPDSEIIKTQETSWTKEIKYLQCEASFSNIEPWTHIKEIGFVGPDGFFDDAPPYLRTTEISQIFNTTEDELNMTYNFRIT